MAKYNYLWIVVRLQVSSTGSSHHRASSWLCGLLSKLYHMSSLAVWLSVLSVFLTRQCAAPHHFCFHPWTGCWPCVWKSCSRFLKSKSLPLEMRFPFQSSAVAGSSGQYPRQMCAQMQVASHQLESPMSLRILMSSIPIDSSSLQFLSLILIW